MERDVKSMTDNVKSLRVMSEALMNEAGSGEFQEKLSTELTELTLAFDEVAKRSRMKSEKLSSAQQRIETLISDIRQVDSGIDQISTRLSRLDVGGADPNSVSELQTEFTVNLWSRKALFLSLSGIILYVMDLKLAEKILYCCSTV